MGVDLRCFGHSSKLDDKNVQGRTFFINFLFEVLIAIPSLIVLYHNYLNFVRAIVDLTATSTKNALKNYKLGEENRGIGASPKYSLGRNERLDPSDTRGS